MLRQNSLKVAGVDGCRAGCLAVIISEKKEDKKDYQRILKCVSFFIAKTFAEVISKTFDCKLICVDIPIGLSDGPNPRQCDIEARKLLGRPRSSSIFPPPVRACLGTHDYKTAREICLKYSGKKLNKQSFFLLEKIRQVDNLMTPASQNRIRENHPEISFLALNDKKPLKYNKKKSLGRKERINLLSSIYPDIKRIIGEAEKPTRVTCDDILDALVSAWTAAQAIIVKAKTLPDKPPIDSKGLRMEFLFPATY